MSLKSFACTVAACCLMAAPAFAQPTIDIVQTGLSAGQRTFGVFLTPDPALYNVDTNNDTIADASSIVFELGLTSLNPQGGAVPTFVGDPTTTITDDFRDDNSAPITNPGFSPFSTPAGEVTAGTGIIVESSLTQTFAALGSTGDLVAFPTTGLLSGRTLAYQFTISDDVGVFSLSGYDAGLDMVVGARIWQANMAFTQTGSFGVAGDFNLDGRVDLSDAGVFSNRFSLGTADAQGTGDFNRDGFVNVSDAGVFSSNFTLSVPLPGSLQVGAVPEPNTLALCGLAVAGFGILGRRRFQG